MKSIVYKTELSNLNDLKERITLAMLSTTPKILNKVKAKKNGKERDQKRTIEKNIR